MRSTADFPPLQRLGMHLDFGQFISAFHERKRKKTPPRLSGGIGALLSLLALSLLISPPDSMATAGPPVKIRMVGEPRYAVPGDPFRGEIRITVGVEAELTNFQLQGEGWAIQSLDVPARKSVGEGVSLNIPFTATPGEPITPLLFSFDLNGQPVQTQFDISKKAYDRLLNPPPIRPEPGSAQQPFPGVDRERAQPGPAPSDKGKESVLCQAVFDELRRIRKEIESLRSEIADTRRMVETSLGREGSGSPAGKISMSIGDLPVLGHRDAPVTVVEFSDYDCPFSQRFYEETFPELKRKWIDAGKVRYVVRPLPLSTRTEARHATAAALCAENQGPFWTLHDLLFKAQGRFKNMSWESVAEKVGLKREPFMQCVAGQGSASRIEKEKAEAAALGIRETPAFVIGRTSRDGVVEGELVQGMNPIGYFDKKLSTMSSARPAQGSPAGRD